MQKSKFQFKKFFKLPSMLTSQGSTNFQSGFTLIEIILVVAIVLGLAGMTPTFYSRFLLQNAASNTADQLVGSIRKAQLYSMVGKQDSAWSVNYSSNTITVFKGINFGGRDQGFDEKFSVNPNVTISNFVE